MTAPFERVLLPIAEENDAVATCEAVEPYLGPTGDVVVVHVIEQTEGAPDKAPIDARKDEADAIFRLVRDRLADDEVAVRTELRYGPDVVDEILDAADEVDATAIAFTPRPSGRWVKLLSGDYARKLTDESDLPVLVLPHPEKEAPEMPGSTGGDDDTHRVLVPIDGSEPSWKALEHACSVYPASEVTALRVLESATGDVYDSMTGDPSSETEREERRERQAADRLFDEARSIVDEHGVELSTITLSGNVTNAIAACAEETDADLIVLGREGRAGLKQRLLGSTTEAVIRRSTVPVTVVR